ncbi:MAG: hypothetical protein ACP5MC_03100 [Candidatus Micrarchaeia archaeon]
MITGLTVSSVSANRPTNEAITNMKFNINFDDVKVENGNVEVSYTFTTDYQGSNNKSVGDLKIIGKVMAKEDKKVADEISKTWQEKKTIPIDFAEDVINLLNFECGSRGTLLAWSIGLVAPLPLSRAKLEQQPQGQANS